MKRALSIAGSDPGGGAGIQADLKTFAAFRVYGACAVTAVTVQNTLGVHEVHPVPPRIVAAQATAVLEDLGADAVKTGMLVDRETVCSVAEVLDRFPPCRIVVDPVTLAKDGTELLQAEGLAAVRERLLPRCEVFTPNLEEASIFLERPVRNVDEMVEAARSLHALGPRYVVLKGGHLEGDPVDIFFDGKRVTKRRIGRIASSSLHGTGCTFAAAMTACLALGSDASEAFDLAGRFVARAIREAPGIGGGAGPLNHYVHVDLPRAREDAT